MEAVSYEQTKVFEAAVQFAKLETIPVSYTHLSVGLAILQAIANVVSSGQVASGVDEIAARSAGYATAFIVAALFGVIGIIASLLLNKKIKERGDVAAEGANADA